MGILRAKLSLISVSPNYSTPHFHTPAPADAADVDNVTKTNPRRFFINV